MKQTKDFFFPLTFPALESKANQANQHKVEVFRGILVLSKIFHCTGEGD